MVFLDNIFKINPIEYDEVWIICYSVGEIQDMFTTYDNVLHVPELAPSESLFKEYRKLVALSKWGKKSFEEYYVPQFLKDMEREDSKKTLQVLLSESKKKNIVLACFCSEEELCHRCIVGGILLNMGCDIQCKSDYKKYKLDI